jgi:hypothetical protein
MGILLYKDSWLACQRAFPPFMQDLAVAMSGSGITWRFLRLYGT